MAPQPAPPAAGSSRGGGMPAPGTLRAGGSSSSIAQAADPRLPPSFSDDAARNPFAPAFALDSIPTPSPAKRKRSEITGDRFIPTREATHGDELSGRFHLLACQSPAANNKRKMPPGVVDYQKDEANRTYKEVIRNECLFFGDNNAQPPPSPRRNYSNSANPSSSLNAPVTPTKTQKLLNYSSPVSVRKLQLASGILDSPTSKKYATSLVSQSSQAILQSPRKVLRYIPKVPFKVLDAPELQDDFYLNLVDWSSTNVLSVGLSTCVYLWQANTARVTKLTDLGPRDSVTSVMWNRRGNYLAVGTNLGYVQLWDAEYTKMVRQFSGHEQRVGALAWNEDLLTSGSRDRNIYFRDIRAQPDRVRKLTGHKQEVCGLVWSPEENQLASGGNDNKLMLWNKGYEQPIHRFSEHRAAVKALDWSPHNHGTLTSGGGSACRRIITWNTLNFTKLHELDTGSQVCNLAWSKTANELVSTHGYSQNQVVVWKYPNMEQLATLTGHTTRVLYLAVSPCGQKIVTGAGDETLRFWDVFNKPKTREDRNSLLSEHTTQIR